MSGESPADNYLDRLIDREALAVYLEDELGPVKTFDIERHQAGHSNETLFLTWGDTEYVVRRPPPGETAETAHEVLREYRVTSALQYSAVPVPDIVLECDDNSIIGSDFYLTKKLEGNVLRDSEPNRFAEKTHRRAIGRELLDVLVEIHETDYDAVELGDFGQPEGFTHRQVERWSKQLDWAFEVTEETREIPVLHDVGDWLAKNIPNEYGQTLVHGDYKLDNVMFGTGVPPRIVGVFDWEMSTLGDPLTDLGWMFAFWRDPKDPPLAVPELETTVMEREGYPTRKELVERYEGKTGRGFDEQRFYRCLAVYKLAALGEMFFRRYLEGNSDDPLYPIMEDRVPAVADRALRIINGDQPL
jgi:aminoglycoside phosphotransferase (APT) family kinase protein